MIFNENWINNIQLQLLKNVTKFIRNSLGLFKSYVKQVVYDKIIAGLV